MTISIGQIDLMRVNQVNADTDTLVKQLTGQGNHSTW